MVHRVVNWLLQELFHARNSPGSSFNGSYVLCCSVSVCLVFSVLCSCYLNALFFTSGTSLAAKFLRANGITLFKVRDEIVNLLGKSDLYFFSPEHPPLTEPAQRALDWAVDQKLKSGCVNLCSETLEMVILWFFEI